MIKFTKFGGCIYIYAAPKFGEFDHEQIHG